MSNQMDMNEDPIFKDLRKFAKEQTGPEAMPAELFEAFRSAAPRKVRRKWITGSLFGILFAAIALPSLSYAGVLPDPITKVVQQVVHVLAAPVRVISNVVNPAPITSAAPVAPTTNPIPDSVTAGSANLATPTPTASTAQVNPPAPAQVKSVPILPTPKSEPKKRDDSGAKNPNPIISPTGEPEERNKNEGEVNKKPNGNSDSNRENDSNGKNSPILPQSRPTPIGGNDSGDHKASGSEKSNKNNSEEKSNKK